VENCVTRFLASGRDGRPGGDSLLGLVRRPNAGLLLAAALAVSAGEAAVAKDATVLPSDAKLLTESQLYLLYKNKTWVWPRGGGFFAGDGTLKAWSAADGAASYATGRWWVNGVGAMCMQAHWHWSNGVMNKRDCFDHQSHRGVIYQKRDPDGSWYIFKSSPVGTEDEINKLREGDLIEEDWSATKVKVDPTQ